MHEFIAVNARSDGILQCKTETEKKSRLKRIQHGSLTDNYNGNHQFWCFRSDHTVIDYKY